MTKRVAILQSNYLPWKGYFDLIASVDEFILYDDRQCPRRDWRNRNKIKTPTGPQWLTVPVVTKGRYFQKICETEIDGADWAQSHWRQLQANYRRAGCFAEIAEWLEPLYSRRYTHISELNRSFLTAICGYLGIGTTINASSAYELHGEKTERLASICAQAGGTVYVSGPSAKNYIVEDVFETAGIKLEWFDYAGYPTYPQLWTGFVHEVSIVDLLFNCGRQSAQFMRFVTK
ncbi:WbqC family protein [Mesorhizobium sp. GbtcB19]|uniref:WbqC family protein n=1 Tax=Mesorhizobium sp. GbtcB19 TaxID=2824764 RepID=UPI001C2F6A1C|nr:WbqC family protein [Mesorhizobium sp. GbtcB19]